MIHLTPSQQAAVLDTEGDSAILAGAGSGKTFVLVEKIARLVQKFHIPLHQILTVTFTEKATEEIREKILKRLRIDDANPDSPDFKDFKTFPVGTIHALAAHLIRSRANPADIPPDFHVLDDFIASLERLKCIRQTLLERIELSDPETLRAMDHLGLHRSIKLLVDLMMKRTGYSQNRSPYANLLQACVKNYESRKKSLNSLDFNDLEDKAVTLLSAHGIKADYRWIIVDEFQDTSPVQWQILSGLHRLPNKTHLVIVGDPRQSIYRFRGADPSLFGEVSNQIVKRGGKLFELRDNFRSATTVLDFSNMISANLFAGGFAPLIATRTESKGSAELLPFANPKGVDERRSVEAETVLKRLLKIYSEGTPWRTMALLFRTRKSVPQYEKILKDLNIPYVTSLGEPLLQRPEVLSLWFFLEKLISPSAKRLRLIENALTFSRLATFKINLPTGKPLEIIETVFAGVLPLFTPQEQKNLGTFHDLLRNLVSLGDKNLKTILENLRILKEEEARIPCPNPNASNNDQLKLMTIHAAKGLEFGTVVLCDTSASLTSRGNRLFLESSDGDILIKEKDSVATGLKHALIKGEAFQSVETKEKEEELEESKRLLYVALTRARDRLIIPYPVPDTGRGARWSQWLVKPT